MPPRRPGPTRVPGPRPGEGKLNLLDVLAVTASIYESSASLRGVAEGHDKRTSSRRTREFHIEWNQTTLKRGSFGA